MPNSSGSCQSSNFYKYFKENMDALGLPAPQSLFGTLQSAVTNATLILTQIDKFGKAVTIGDLIKAGTKLEMLGYIAGCAAAFYVGAVIGSIAVATARSLSSGTTLWDVISTANKHNLNRSWLPPNLQRWPGIYDRSVANRNTCRYGVVVV